MRVLVVEDETALRERLTAVLEDGGYAVDAVEDGQSAERAGLREDYDAAVLDLGLPQLDGISVLRRWRDAGRRMPVLILTARARWSDKLEGFNAGADDYLIKPFEMQEVLLRVRALIRRNAGHASNTLKCGPLELDVHASRIAVNGVPLQLTTKEFRILAYMMHHPGRVISRAQLIEHIYDSSSTPDSNVIDVLLARIRRKLSVNVIQTVRGQGYRLAMPRA